MKRRILYTVLFIVVLLACDRIIGLCLNKGLSTYFGLDQHSEVLFIGHSHLMLAVDKTEFENRTHTTVSKYCREGVNVADRYQMVRQFLSLPESDSLRYVIYGVDQFMFTGEGLSDNSYKLFYPFMDNQVMNDYIRSSTDFKDYFLHKVLCTTRYSDALLNSAARGWMHNWSNYKFGNLDVDNLIEQVASDKQRHIKFEGELVGYFEQTLEMLEDRGLTVILVNTPIARPLNDYEPEQYRRFTDYMKQTDATSDNVFYWDLNPEYSERYELFFDPIHLNAEGQKVINEELVERFTELKSAL